MNILVTGGAGFIGSHLCDLLLKDEANNICVIDNLSLGKKENISHLSTNSNFKFYQFDLLNQTELSIIFEKEKFDMVFHLAANSDIAKSFNDPGTDLNNTFLTTFNVLNMMRIHGVKKIAFASTSAIYGDTIETLHENFGPLFPVSHYGAGKLASEAFLSSFSASYSIQTWIIRFPNVVGERTTHGILFDFVKKIRNNPDTLEVLGNGEQNKPYVYVKDLVEAIVFVWKNTNDRLNYFNIGVDTTTKVKDIAHMVLEEMNEQREIVYTGGDRGWVGDVPFFSYNLDKIHKLGWKAKNSSNDAVRLSIRSILNAESK
ncbi:epimerase [Pedobacter sp. HMWF019]|uniref:NAD-dependent epimerase/dehydratase family protein n=1 Tax=Pedobacter sp. HMWF019 TaxID=2056856 RepID=UPI000D388E96|nr:NAD-dependent epimerase/dehydratase family protein [Pedobacter sp. HMWF019]PTS93923.1 epimerase [Pedobacter sp. HMWF019]